MNTQVWLVASQVELFTNREVPSKNIYREGAQMKRLLLLLFRFADALLFSCSRVSANSAGVTGIVKDSNGAVIAGVDVKLTDTKPGQS